MRTSELGLVVYQKKSKIIVDQEGFVMFTKTNDLCFIWRDGFMAL